MENKQKIFAIGANKIRKNKNWSQEFLASKIKNGKRGTVSSWLRGRTKFPEERFEEFANIFNTTVEAIMQIGREEKSKQDGFKNRESEIEKRVAEIEKKLDSSKENHNTADITTQRHIKTLGKFKQKDLALEINELLVEIEEIDLTALKEARRLLRLLKKDVEEDLKKRPAANGED